MMRAPPEIPEVLFLVSVRILTKRYPPQILGISAVYRTDAAGNRLN